MNQTTLAQAFKNAIEAEKQAERFYSILLTFTDDNKVVGFLEELAKQEKNHASEIESLSHLVGAGELPEKSTDTLPILIKAPEWVDVSDMTFTEAIELAIETEKKAAAYYGALEKNTTGRVAEFFELMSRKEEGHATMLEEKMRKLDIPTVKMKKE